MKLADEQWLLIAHQHNLGFLADKRQVFINSVERSAPAVAITTVFTLYSLQTVVAIFPQFHCPAELTNPQIGNNMMYIMYISEERDDYDS